MRALTVPVFALGGVDLARVGGGVRLGARVACIGAVLGAATRRGARGAAASAIGIVDELRAAMKIRVVGFSVLGASALVAAGLGLFAFDFPRLSTNEMAPTLRARDLLLACRVCGASGAWRRGGVRQPPDSQAGAVASRRVVAGPGDKVEVKKGRILVNDRPLVDEKGDRSAGRHRRRRLAAACVPDQLETVGKHRFQVLGDARAELTEARAPPRRSRTSTSWSPTGEPSSATAATSARSRAPTSARSSCA